MGNNILVSIIMPAYNAESFIHEAINSVIDQTYSNWELIIIDDGSTDTTAKNVNEWLLKDKRIQYYYQENGKQGKARNFGISKSKGVYLAFLDADDLWMPEKLEIQLEEIKAKNVDLVFSDSYIFNDKKVSKRNKKMNTLNMFFKGREALKLFLQINRIPLLTALVKKEKILLVNGFSEKRVVQNAEDYHLWLKMIINGCVFYGSDKILASYRIHSKSATSEDKLAGKQKLEVFFDLRQNYPEEKHIILKSLKRELQKQCEESFFNTKLDINKIIDENCRYLNKQYYSFFFKFLYIFLGKRITKKTINILLNA